MTEWRRLSGQWKSPLVFSPCGRFQVAYIMQCNGANYVLPLVSGFSKSASAAHFQQSSPRQITDERDQFGIIHRTVLKCVHDDQSQIQGFKPVGMDIAMFAFVGKNALHHCNRFAAYGFFVKRHVFTLPWGEGLTAFQAPTPLVAGDTA
ncbi:hypothetical protein J2Z75_005812 [Rhizobium herbae]|uniref:Uncharacterized protein n=1 Tax=Rhizobium herbae TaxID=508661 RepID=A0ABS4EWW8_9HYPH|nr:hypothetical protein [Rhizobium herbae]